MALDLQLRAAFARSTRDAEGASESGGDPAHKLLLAEKGRKGLAVAFKLLIRARQQSNIPRAGAQLKAPELLVLAAEVAVKNGEFDTAREACHEFFLDSWGTKDQFYCRALFVKALVINDSICRDGLVGAEATRRRSRAVGFLLQALEIAVEAGVRYAFLMYNASVHAWSILRPALRRGRAGHHALELAKFVDALEGVGDTDLRWRYTLLAALSIALEDAGDSVAAAIRAVAGFQHAEANLLRASEAAEAGRVTIREAKGRVARAQSLIRGLEEGGGKIEKNESPREDDTNREGGNHGGVSGDSGEETSDPSLSPSAAGAVLQVALAEAGTSLAKAEAEAIEGTRRLDPLVKAASDASDLADRAWLLLAHAAAGSAAEGGIEAKKLLETTQAQAAQDPRRGALLLLQQTTSGVLSGDAALAALQTLADSVDPETTALAEQIGLPAKHPKLPAVSAAMASSGREEGAGSSSGDQGEGHGGGGKEETAAAIGVVATAPSANVQSILVDLGRAALKAVGINSINSTGTCTGLGNGGSGGSGSAIGAAAQSPSSLLVNFAKACRARASLSARKGGAIVGQGGGGQHPSAGSPAITGSEVVTTKPRLEFLTSELTAQGALSDAPSGGTSGTNGVLTRTARVPLKLDARRTEAQRLAHRVEALKRVERALLNSKRLGNPDLLQEGCCLAFAIGFPLLGRRHRKHVHRCFALAAQILQDLESPLSRLRAQLHLEVAKCEMDSDFLAKAAGHVDKALKQDYGVSDLATLAPEGPLDGEWDENGVAFSEADGSESGPDDDGSRRLKEARNDALNDVQRPLDRFMTPLADFLRLKMGVDVEPSEAEDKAAMLIDQARDSVDPFLRHSLLLRAAQQLEQATRTPPVHETVVDASSSNEKKPLAENKVVTGGEGSTSEESRVSEVECAAAVFANADADGSSVDVDDAEPPSPSSKRRARLWSTLLELAWEPSTQEQGGRKHDPGVQSNGAGKADNYMNSSKSRMKSNKRDLRLARRAAVAVLDGGKWDPQKNRELVVMQARAQFTLGETYVEQLRGINPGSTKNAYEGSDRLEKGGPATSTTMAGNEVEIINGQKHLDLDPCTMGIATATCDPEVPSELADLLDLLKTRACGCFVAGIRRGLLAKEVVLVENGAVYVHNFHLPVWRRRLHAMAMPHLKKALEAGVTALRTLSSRDTVLLCSTYESLARLMSASSDASEHSKAEELCLQAVLALDRPTVAGDEGAKGAGKPGAGAKKGAAAAAQGKSPAKKGAPSKGDGASGDSTGRRATLGELKGVVEVRAQCQATRGGPTAVTGEGRPLLQALALLTATSIVPRESSDDLVERCTGVMMEYRRKLEAISLDMKVSTSAMDGSVMVPAPAHGGDNGDGNHGDNLDVFVVLSTRSDTTLEEDQAELDLVGELWCRLGKERLRRGMKRKAEECCGYVTELLPQMIADRRRVHTGLWRWLAVAEGLWGHVVAAKIVPESQEKPLQDELRRASMKHLATAARYGALSNSEAVILDVAKRFWKVALPLADTSTGRAIVLSPLRSLLKEMAKREVVDGGSFRTQLYVLLFECYADRSEWKAGLAAVSDAFKFISLEFQRPLWKWRVVFLSRLGKTALDGVAKTKESDQVLQAKNWCTLARSSSDPHQQLSAYLKALESLGDRFERVDCLVEMGEWLTGQGLTRGGIDYLASALDLLYDVEEQSMTQPGIWNGGERGLPETPNSGGRRVKGLSGDGVARRGSTRPQQTSSGCKGSSSSRASISRGASGGKPRFQGPASTTMSETDANGFPDVLDVGHLEIAVRILTIMARNSPSTFDERTDLIMQAYYFLGRIAETISETVARGARLRLYKDAVPEGSERVKTTFEDWCDSAGYSPGGPNAAPKFKMNLRDWAYWRPQAEEREFYKWMVSPPPGRERFVIGPLTIDKAPLLFCYLVDLAECMESHGMAAHAAAPLAMCELVAKICLDENSVPRGISGGQEATTAVADPTVSSRSGAVTGKKGVTEAVGVGDTGTAAVEQLPGYVECAFPGLALVCLRRARLLFKLGPACNKAALTAVLAAGPLGVSKEELTRRGEEVEQILKQRRDEDTRDSRVSATTNVTLTNTEASISVPGEAVVGRKQGRMITEAVPSRLRKLEDRHMWALLAKEAVTLGECRVAAEYLAAAQRHNDAFQDRDNMIRCLEAQAALCDAQGHPEQALPCLLRASALLKRAEGGGDATRWARIAIALGGVMQRSGMGNAKARRTLQVACDALGAKVVESKPLSKDARHVDGDVALKGGMDLDAVVAFSECMCLLVETSSSVESPSGTTSTSTLASTLTSAVEPPGNISDSRRAPRNNARNCTNPAAHIVGNSATNASQGVDQSKGNEARDSAIAVQQLRSAAELLRPLGPSVPLATVLRRIAREWVRKWTTVTLTGNRQDTNVGHSRARTVSGRTILLDIESSANGGRETFLENAASCLAEARGHLETLVPSAEPIDEVLPLSTPAHLCGEKVSDRPQTANGQGEEGRAEKAASGKGKLPGKGQGKGSKSKGLAGGGEAGGHGQSTESIGQVDSTKSSLGDRESPSRVDGFVSTPLGRALVMVQLEEAAVRAMLGRVRGETHSEKKAIEAAANAQGVNPVDRYMEASRPIVHPTAKDMELPQIEQALSLAGAGKERILLATADHLYSLALAWEGAALASLAVRAGLSDGAWEPRPPPPPPPISPPQTETPAGKTGKGGTKGCGNQSGKGRKGSSAAVMVAMELAEEVRAPILPLEENFDLRAQARWKLERAIEEGSRAKRWDAVGVAAFALGELIGGYDTAAAAGALMLHQSCRARRMLLHLVHEALPLSHRCRLSLDRIATAQGNLAGIHALDVCDPSLLAPSPLLTVAETWAGGDGSGNGRVVTPDEFPPAASARRFLENYLDGWGRLECGETTGVSLAALPLGLGVLSLQISPDGTTLYAAGYASTTAASSVGVATVEVLGDAMVWRYEMKPSEMGMLSQLESRMAAFEAAVGHHCLKYGDDEGAMFDYCTSETVPRSMPSEANTSSGPSGSSVSKDLPAGSVKPSSAPDTARCDIEFDNIREEMEAILSPLWAPDIEGNISPFLLRCRTERISLVLLLDERLTKLPIEASSVLEGVPAVSRDLSLHVLRHRLKAAEVTGDEVSNARMRYIADPLLEDGGISAPPNVTEVVTPTITGSSKASLNTTSSAVSGNRDRRRESTLQTLRGLTALMVTGGGKGVARGGRVNVSSWTGIAGDDHVPGVREWQSLISGDSAVESGGDGKRGGGFLYYGPGRCLSKLPPRYLAGLSTSCQAAILIDRADNDASHRRESKQDTNKSKDEVELERPLQVAALFSLAGCQSVLLNLWPSTLHNNRRIFCSLFRGWGEECLTLGDAVSAIRGEVALKPRARFCTVLYGLPTLKFGE